MNGRWFFSFGPPTDVPALVAVFAALVLLWQGRRISSAFQNAPRALVVGLLAGLAAALSAGYIGYYLRGGPRIIDATSYWLEARALADGYVTWPIQEPTASVRGRFLFMSGPVDAPRLGVIFPPGYPLLLATGFLLGVPLAVGPCIAALIVVATYALARRLTQKEGPALLAASLSVLSGALRYHTADTMSHGWAALLFTSSLVFAYRAADSATARARFVSALLSGLSLGWLFATRPISGMVLFVALTLVAFELRTWTRLSLFAAALLPVGLFLLEQRVVTGSFWTSSQSAYYAVADGPPGCFQYGFGPGIGCLHEHGEYVGAVLRNGLGWKAAALTTLRRLRLHLIDVANLEPLVLLVVVAPWVAWSQNRKPIARLCARRTSTLALAVVAIVLAYVPFYFDASYAGGGARLFADVLPLEHVLIAISTAGLVESARQRFASFDLPRASAWISALSLLGFGIHANFEHLMLRDRDGGRPFFEPAVLARAKVDRGLLFVGTDHAFNLAYDPRARDAQRELVVAREYGDDRDRMLWERLGHPTSHRYVFEGRAVTSPGVVPWSPPPSQLPYRLEAEAEWPPLRQLGGYFEPIFAQGTCAWGGRLLAVRTQRDNPFDGAISFPVPFPGSFRIGVHVAWQGAVAARFVLRSSPNGPPLATWSFVPQRRDLACAMLPEELVQLTDRGLLEVTARGGSELFLDAIALDPLAPMADAR